MIRLGEFLLYNQRTHSTLLLFRYSTLSLFIHEHELCKSDTEMKSSMSSLHAELYLVDRNLDEMLSLFWSHSMHLLDR